MNKQAFMLRFGFALSALLLAANAHADIYNYSFSGSSNGGTGSATMSVEIDGSPQVTIDLSNISPTTLDDGTGVNTPGITAFGMDFDPGNLSLVSWSLTADKYSVDANGNFVAPPTQVVLASGSNGVENTNVATGGCTETETVKVQGKDTKVCSWQLVADFDLGQIQVEWAAATETNPNIDGALYNPDLVGQNQTVTGPNPYFTDAQLVLVFSDNITGVVTRFTQNGDYSPFVRMQRVGNGGSLKLGATELEPPVPPTGVPEPGTALLFGLGLAGLVFRNKRRHSSDQNFSGLMPA